MVDLILIGLGAWVLGSVAVGLPTAWVLGALGERRGPSLDVEPRIGQEAGVPR